MEHDGFFLSLRNGGILKLTVTGKYSPDFHTFEFSRLDEPKPRFTFHLRADSEGEEDTTKAMSALVGMINDSLSLGGYRLSFKSVHSEDGALLYDDWDKFTAEYFAGEEQEGEEVNLVSWALFVFEKIPS